jgi:hypothetical protein
MSSLSHSLLAVGARRGLSFALLALLGSSFCFAQQTSFVPILQTTAQYDSNRLLDPVTNQSAETYQAQLEAYIRRRTLRSTLELRPLLIYQYSSLPGVNRWEALVDLKSIFQTSRSTTTVLGEYHREDAFNAQYGVAAFNPVNPNLPDTAGGTGTVVTGLNKSTYSIAPDFEYQLSQRFTVEGLATLDAVRYDTEIPGQFVSYNAPYAELDGYWAFGPRTSIGGGPFYTLYDPTQDDAQRVSGYGVNLVLKELWSQAARSSLSLRLEHDTFTGLGLPETSKDTVGLEWTGVYKRPTDSLQYAIGRFIEPSSVGSLVALNQVRIQYGHRFSVYTRFNGAVRVSRGEDLSDGSKEDHVNVQLGLTRLITEAWYIAGGYRFAYQKFDTSAGSAHSHGAFISVGFHGREPPTD